MCRICDGEDLTSVTSLDISGCKNVIAIPILPRLTKLYCDGCTGLTAIPILSNLIELYCGDCTGLTEIPILPSLTKLQCNDCYWLKRSPENTKEIWENKIKRLVKAQTIFRKYISKKKFYRFKCAYNLWFFHFNPEMGCRYAMRQFQSRLE